MNHIRPDRLNNVDLRQAANAAMAVIDATQVRFTPEEQAVGMCAAFRILAEEQGVDPAELLSVTSNVMHWAEGRRPEFKAVAQYVNEELA